MVKPSSPQGYFESPQDREVLKRLIQDELRKVHGTTQRSGPTSSDYYAPEVKLVWVPAGGVVASTGYEPTGTGTGTNTLSSTSCHVHRIDQLSSGPEVAYAGYDIDVVNPTPVTIPGSQWALAVRENSGPYVPVMFAGAGLVSPLTTKGDIWGFGPGDTRIPVGTDGSILTADSTVTLGVRYTSLSQGTAGTDVNWAWASGAITLNIPDASYTARGLVTLTDQRLGLGIKTVDTLVINDTSSGAGYLSLPDLNAFISMWTGTAGEIPFSVIQTTGADGLSNSAPTLMSGSNTSTDYLGLVIHAPRGLVVPGRLTLIGADSSNRQWCYAIQKQSTGAMYAGMTGTGGGGDTFVGGICTALGSGGSSSITIGTTPVTGGTSGDILTDAGGVAGSSSLSSLLDGLGGLGGAGTTYGG